MNKKLLRHYCPQIIHRIYSETKFFLRYHFNPKGLASEMVRGILGYEMDWNNPQDLNQKINWMKFNYDTSEWTLLADKYLVRDYVKERIGEEVLPKLYGVWKRAEEIDFNLLPLKFVLKTNHGSGMVIPVLDKAVVDKRDVEQKLNKWVKLKFGYDTIEPHYTKIKPVIFAEEYIENDTVFSSSLVDYKVFCFSGKPYCIMVCTDRILRQHANFSFYDCEWNLMENMLSGRHSGESKLTPKPSCLPKLLKYASQLASGHPQVRVDFYIVNNKIYFGEMTFTSQGGYMDYISRDYSLAMGKLVSL